MINRSTGKAGTVPAPWGMEWGLIKPLTLVSEGGKAVDEEEIWYGGHPFPI